MNNPKPKPSQRAAAKKPAQPRSRQMGLSKQSVAKANLAIRGSTSRRETVPVAQSRLRTTGAPKQNNLPNGDVIIEHLEFIKDIPG